MQPSDGAKLGRVGLNSSAEECHVAGFTDAYAAYLKGPGRRASHDGWVLMFIGWSVTAVAVATFMFGPSENHYDRFTGLTPFQHTQMNPGPILRVGLFCLAGGNRLRAKGGISRESYLQAHYRLISDDGRVSATRFMSATWAMTISTYR
jgi:hypothetical protein